MATVARLLTGGNLSKPISDDFGCQKLAMQYIRRELHEANEANLIDEQDMYIFDLRPMTDPLYLVSCNACRKPIKASQYAIHAELCTSLTSLEEIGLELDGNTGHKKPPRKERRKLPVVHSTTPVGERDKFENLDISDISASESQLETPYAETKNGPLILESSEVSPGNTNSLANTIPRPRKRSKMVTAEGPLPILDHFAPARGAIPQETVSCCENPRTLEAGSEKVSDNVVGQQMHRELTELHRLNKETKGCSSEYIHERAVQENVVTKLMSSPSSSSLNQISDDRLDKEGDHPTYAVHKPDQTLAQNSELYSCRPGGFPPAMSISNPFSVNNVLTPHTSLGKMSSYFSNSYSFADSSGKSLGSLQQPEGSVSVM